MLAQLPTKRADARAVRRGPQDERSRVGRFQHLAAAGSKPAPAPVLTRWPPTTTWSASTPTLWSMCSTGCAGPPGPTRRPWPGRRVGPTRMPCAPASAREADAAAASVHLPALAFEAAPGRPGSVMVRFAGRHGGIGTIVIADDPVLRSTLCWLAGHRDGEPYLRAVLAAVRSQEDVDGPWYHERAVELLWGPRNQKHSRARQAPPVRRLVELLLQAQVELDAPVSETPAPTAKKRRKGRDEERSRARVLLRRLLHRGVPRHRRRYQSRPPPPPAAPAAETGYDMRPRQVFRLRIEGHHNPKGAQPSLGLCAAPPATGSSTTPGSAAKPLSNTAAPSRRSPSRTS